MTENGAVIGAEAAYNAPYDEADRLNCLKADLAVEIRKNLSYGDIVEAIQEAPDQLQQYLYECWTQRDLCDLGASVDDAVGYYVDMLAEKQARKELGL